MTIRRTSEDPRRSPVFLRKDLLAEGWSDRAIAAQVRAGDWVRVRRGAFLAAESWRSLDATGRHEMVSRAVLLQGKTELVLSHLSGLPLYDINPWDITFSDVHVTRRDGRCGRHEAGVHQHRGLIEDGDVVIRHGVPVMSGTRLALECTTMLDTEHALVVVEQLIHNKATTLDDVRRRYRAMDRWPYTLLTDLALRLVEPQHESVAEGRLAYLFWRQSLPVPVPQYPVRDRNGRVFARLDFTLPTYGVYFEFDGKMKYDALLRAGETAADAVMREKRREQRVYEATGWRCFRVTWADLADPERLAERIRVFLGQAIAS